MKKKNRLDRILEIPKEVYSNMPNVILTAFDDIFLENYKGILEYEDYYIKINTEIGIINIGGSNLNLEKMTDENIRITGKIEEISLERKFEN